MLGVFKRLGVGNHPGGIDNPGRLLRRVRARQGVLLLVLLALAASEHAHAWAQLRGGSGRPGALVLADETLDVVATQDLLGESEELGLFLSPGLVETPRGHVGLARDAASGECVLVIVRELGRSAPVRAPVPSCLWGWLQAYDARNDALLICSRSHAGGPVLQSVSWEGRVRWAVAPAQLGVQPLDAALAWGCAGVALDEANARVVAAFHESRQGFDYPRHRVAAIAVDTGEVLWWAQIPVTAAVRGDVALPLLDGSGANFLPLATTLTTSGIVVSGLQFNPAPLNPDRSRPDAEYKAAQFAVGWLANDGSVRGMKFSQLDPRDATSGAAATGRPSDGGSFWAASQGLVAAVALGDKLLVINPDLTEPLGAATLASVDGLQRGLLGWSAPSWDGERIVVPVSKGIGVYSARASEPALEWPWAVEEPSAVVDDVALTNRGNVLVLTTGDLREAPEPDIYRAYNLTGEATTLVRLDGGTGAVLQRVPVRSTLNYIAHADVANLTQPPQLVPVGTSALAVVDSLGHVALLAPAPEAQKPRLALSDAYPAPGALVTLEATPPAGASAERTLVRWGDGTWEDLLGAPALQHAYPTPERYEVLVTQVYADGRTGTATAIVDVGGTPLTPLQRAFSPERQEITFFILGLAITGVGATAGLLRLRRSRRAFERACRALEELARAGPAAFEEGIPAQVGAARRLAADSRITPLQLSFVERRAAELTASVRKSHLRHDFAFLPTSLVLLLEEMLADGRITTWEQRHFLDAVDREPTLDAQQKQEVRALVRRWLETDASTQRH